MFFFCRFLISRFVVSLVGASSVAWLNVHTMEDAKEIAFLLLNNTARSVVSPLFISDQCYDTLVMELNVFDKECLLSTLSTCAGLGIVVLSLLLKLPIANNMYLAKSADGLSLTSLYLETSMYLSVLCYFFMLEPPAPFSTYGEKYSLMAGNFLLASLAWTYSGKGWLFRIASVAGLVACFFLFTNLPPDMRKYLIYYSSSGALLARTPQIMMNFRNGHTGVLSLGSLVAAISGAVVRVLTVLKQVPDFLAAAGELLPLSLNIVILIQVILYRQATKDHFAKLEKAKKE